MSSIRRTTNTLAALAVAAVLFAGCGHSGSTAKVASHATSTTNTAVSTTVASTTTVTSKSAAAKAAEKAKQSKKDKAAKKKAKQAEQAGSTQTAPDGANGQQSAPAPAPQATQAPAPQPVPQPAPQATQSPAPAPSTHDTACNLNADEQRFLTLMNQHRASVGMGALACSGNATGVARRWSATWPVQPTTLVHNPNMVSDMSAAIGSWSSLGENIGYGTGTGDLVATTDAALWASPTHHANIVSPKYTHVGVGVARGTDASGQPKLFVTFDFYG